MSALPNSINYGEVIPSLPDNSRSFQVASTPVNGASFAPSSIIQVDLNKRGFIDPQSIYIRYKAVVASATTASEMIGTPVYTPIQKMETIIGSTQIESINQFNQTANMLVNLTQDVASKYGQQYAYGYGGSSTASPNMSALDGKTIVAAGETFFVSAPIPCMLTSCEKLIPAFALPQIRLQFTLDSLANMFSVIGGVTGLTISNFEVCYTIIDMGAEIEQMVMSMGSFYLKTQSFFNMATTLNSSTSGSVTIPYNVQFASIKSLFAIFAGTASSSVNKWGDSFDPTTGNGDFSFTIGGVQYPQRTLSTVNNKAGLLQSLRQAVGSIYGSTNSLSINSIEFLRNSGDTTTSAEPAKFYIGVSTEKLHSHALLTGISSQGSAILLNMNTATSTAQAHTVNLIVNYDALLTIDVVNGQVTVVK